MEYRRLGDSGLKVSAIGLGSWLTLGNAVDGAETERIVSAAFEAGINLFDTADVYNRGEAERALGRAVGGLPRHRLVLATKCYFPMSDDPNDRGLSRKHVIESAHRSLRRLRTGYLDLYQCHRPDPDVPLAETCAAMDTLIRRGDVLYWGVSAWPGALIEEAVGLCRAHGWFAPISNQPCYNLLDRRIESEVLPASRRVGVGQLAYSPLAQGVLTGKYAAGAAAPAGSRAADPRFGHFVERFLDPALLQRVERFVGLAAARGIAPVGLALAFCLRLPDVASVLVGVRSADQLQQNLAAFDTAGTVSSARSGSAAAGPRTALTPALLDELDELFPAP
ncbi:MAG: aldo/keto reductase family protein [Planctomycetes bacterium]|nr:aldo/keto reductase family protein [Planctomycetota bacterium]